MTLHCHKDGRWFVRYGKDGKDIKKYFGRGEIARARAEHFDQELQASRGKIKYGAGPSVAEICEEYHEHHIVEKSTAKTDFYRLDRVILPLLGMIPAESLNTQHLNDYVQARIKAGKSLRTVDREIDILRSAYNWAQAQDPPLIIRNALSKFRLNIPKRAKPPPVTMEEFERLLMHSPAHLIRGMLLQWYCGMTAGGEVSRVKWIDVDLSNREIRVESAFKGGPAERLVSIHPDFMPLLERWREEDCCDIQEGKSVALVPVVHYYLKPAVSLKSAWRSAKKNAGVARKLRLTDFRRAWFTNALRHGADLKTISEMGGHSRPDTTLIEYQHVYREQHHEAIAKIPAVKIPRSGLIRTMGKKKG